MTCPLTSIAATAAGIALGLLRAASRRNAYTRQQRGATEANRRSHAHRFAAGRAIPADLEGRDRLRWNLERRRREIAAVHGLFDEVHDANAIATSCVHDKQWRRYADELVKTLGHKP